METDISTTKQEIPQNTPPVCSGRRLRRMFSNPQRLADEIAWSMTSYAMYRERNPNGGEPFLRDDLCALAQKSPGHVYLAATHILETYFDRREVESMVYAHSLYYLSKLLSQVPKPGTFFLRGSSGFYQSFCAAHGFTRIQADPDFKLLNAYLNACTYLDRHDMKARFLEDGNGGTALSYGPAAHIMGLGLIVANRYLQKLPEDKNDQGKIILNQGLTLVTNQMNWFLYDRTQVKLLPCAVEFLCNHAPEDWINSRRSLIKGVTPRICALSETGEGHLFGLTEKGLKRWQSLYHEGSPALCATNESLTPPPHSQPDPALR